MTNRDILIHYAACLAIGIAVTHYTGYILAGLAAFTAASWIITHESQTRQRP